MRGPQPWRTNRARALRSRLTRAEEKLWAELRNRQVAGYKFGRQVAIGPYFTDFACREGRLTVEVDGATHGTDEEVISDAARTATLKQLGYHVYRVMNDDIEHNLPGVIDSIFNELERQR